MLLAKKIETPFYRIVNDTFYLQDEWNKTHIPFIYQTIFVHLHLLFEVEQHFIIDGGNLSTIDSAGVALLDEIFETYDHSIHELHNFSSANIDKIKIFSVQGLLKVEPRPHDSLLLLIGDFLYTKYIQLKAVVILTADIFYWSWKGLFDHSGHRQGSFTIQSLQIGFNALPIVGLLSFIIGLILAIQTAVQLRQFGAEQFLANLLAFSLARELSPLITAIILAGRSGSAIASEIATMKVTEELDALKMMALNPLRYVIAPKLHAVTVCMPLLVLFSLIVGIFGGVIVAVSILGLSAQSFLTSCLRVVSIKDLFITMLKSVAFAWQIVIIGSYYGLNVEGGSDAVGRATTKAVVASIFSVIMMDAFFSMIYLFK